MGDVRCGRVGGQVRQRWGHVGSRTGEASEMCVRETCKNRCSRRKNGKSRYAYRFSPLKRLRATNPPFQGAVLLCDRPLNVRRAVAS